MLLLLLRFLLLRQRLLRPSASGFASKLLKHYYLVTMYLASCLRLPAGGAPDSP